MSLFLLDVVSMEKKQGEQQRRMGWTVLLESSKRKRFELAKGSEPLLAAFVVCCTKFSLALMTRYLAVIGEN